MKKIFLLVMLALTICSSCFANEQAIVDSFKTMVSNKIAPIEATYANSKPVITKHGGDNIYPAYYTKLEEVLEYDIDVQKTDSLIKPYRGIVKLARIVYSYGTHYSYESAQFASGGLVDYAWRTSIFYDYVDGKWQPDFYEYAGLGNVRIRENGDNIYNAFKFNESYLN